MKRKGKENFRNLKSTYIDALQNELRMVRSLISSNTGKRLKWKLELNCLLKVVKSPISKIFSDVNLQDFL